MAKARFVQLKNPRSGHYIKIDRKLGKVLEYKDSDGPYEGIPIARRKRVKEEHNG